ncbi:MAG: translation initiation factor IF-2 [Candidatus Magasanikbacteria bacterium]|uniref:Translation initiation factor IF-2 n=1 Tax=Candidatus Magasanikbacteria bacterium CG10_big_fil_rev_8_21_14_0_10_38_6 TaxID=1974647 RepID=A0A2M6P0V9_9BACT|nr:translation initiation factor IF-2 [Candidatus Magasanikbacteria bacterium]PIR77337.1 MAG: translation initiation factor IF-2 [Candidatus Magasanikbacteria bacterium CG10_big_fil_rev_8_21_14_0_10_38_6]
MNVTELARRLRVNTKVLLDILPGYGFDIGKKSIKIDDRMANQVMKQWKRIKYDLDRKQREELEDKKRKERELRKQEGVTVSLPRLITVRDFSDRLQLPVTQVITELMKSGILANQNQNIDYDTAAIMAEELGFHPVQVSTKDVVDESKEEERTNALEKALKRGEHTTSRPPVVVVMGHVDHGKTKLLDTIRKANIIDTEAGGITQHIGAYQTVWQDPKTKAERAISFIDTPGHEAFTVMRSRGATVADIAILIVAADDGVKPQTKEAIQIIKAAKLPFVVAINKIDKDTADVMKTKTELANSGVQPEEWGGTIPMIEISAKENLNIDVLLDMILLVADLHEDDIQADVHTLAVGTIIESHLDKNMGPVATVLVQAGTLKKGDPLVVNGEIYGKVRAMRDDHGKNIDDAGPSVPAQIIGFKVAPEMGDILDVASVDSAEKIDVKQKRNEQTGAVKQTVINAHSDQEHEEKKKTLNLVIKADVLGSLEALIGSLQKMRHDEVGIKIVGKGLGNITETDVNKAEAAHATIIGFNVQATPIAEDSMREHKITFLRYTVIYDIINWAKEALTSLLDEKVIITELGQMNVLAIFRTDKKAMTVGGLITEGKIEKGSLVRIMRDKEQIGEGVISTCQIGQQSVKSIPAGSEGGIKYEGKTKIEVGDTIEAYKEESQIRELELI